MGECSVTPASKDPRAIARKYQLELCKRAVEENIIVCLRTGCGKTHIAVLLMYELAHLIRQPSREICVFLAPTVPLVRQQAMVIENSTDFKVKSYFGHHKHSKDHDEWSKEIEQAEVLVMTPQILLQNLRHCFIRMENIGLLIFDECHHAQVQKRHPYAQIMKEFYKANIMKVPRIFGMTASPSVGKGGSNQLNYSRCINSLENLLDAKVCSVEDNLELESIVASPEIKVYFYGPVVYTDSSLILADIKKLDRIKHQCISMATQKISDVKDRQKKLKLLCRMHANLIFCLENIGLYGALRAVKVLLASEQFDMAETEDISSDDACIADLYLSKAATVLSYDVSDDNASSDSSELTLEEPFFSKKLSVLVGILSTHRFRENIKCIIFVKRIIIARALAYILGSLKPLEFWKCEFLVGMHSGLKHMSRKKMNTIVEKFSSGEVNLLIATNVAEEGLDIQACCLVVRFDLPETVASFIQSRGRARMLKSEYVFLVERGNQNDEKLLNDFMSGEDIMNKEILSRTSGDTFDDLEEIYYKIDSTGASISTACSISLLHHYCAKLSRDIYFTPSPQFLYMDDLDGNVCRVILPPNAAIRQVDSLPFPSKDEAKRAACLKACMELHERGALTNYLLPNSCDGNKKGSAAHHNACSRNEDEFLREELHETLVPAALKVPWTECVDHINMYFYCIRFVPIPEDRQYRMFGLFIMDHLPREAETMEVDLHLAHGRIVKTGLLPMGEVTLDREQIMLAQKFQEMFLKIILDRSQFLSDYVALGKNDSAQQNSSTFYLLLPVMQPSYRESMVIDWTIIKRCLSSPVFRSPINCYQGSPSTSDTLEFIDGPVDTCNFQDSLVFTPHNKSFFFIDGILHGTDADSQYKGSRVSSYADYYKERYALASLLDASVYTQLLQAKTEILTRIQQEILRFMYTSPFIFNIQLSHPKQPFLKAKHLFLLRNLLHNRLQENTETREIEEHFVELPPELCLLKVVGFSKDIGSSLSLLPSLMHRLESLLVAIELKGILLASFPEASKIPANCILEALTTEKCLERLSLERFEVLGDAFLKYVVGRHSFLSYEGLDEGQLTQKRSNLVNNSHLYKLAICNNLQVYIRDELFDPSQFFALGRPCTVMCDVDTESKIHYRQNNDSVEDGAVTSNLKCSKSHRWLHRKTIADVVEALVGVFLVESGFKAAIAFLRWVGIETDFDVQNVHRSCYQSQNNISLTECIDIYALEEVIGYKFKHKGLLLQAFVHPSYNKHSGGCYQKLEFLGDAVLEYLITSYLYSVYPDLKPGQITDLRSISVNNNSFARVAVQQSFHKYLIKDSCSLTEAIKKFEEYMHLYDLEGDLLEEPACPKVLGDIVESCLGAVLLDSGFNLTYLWSLMLTILEPVLGFSSLQINPIRELRELCQGHNFELGLPDPVRDHGIFIVRVEVDIGSKCHTFSATNLNSKAARRMAAQEALSKLKALGFKHKNKSLGEIVRTTQKKEPKLIGFDEEPIVIEGADVGSISLEKLKIQEVLKVPGKLCLLDVAGASSSSRNSAHQKQLSLTLEFAEKPEAVTSETGGGDNYHPEPLMLNKFETGVMTENRKRKEITGLHKTARSQLLELCTANYWNSPSFVCCKEEGPSHLRMFTYKIVIQVEGATTTILECFSEPKPQKKAAQEQAAAGALWYLRHLGYLREPSFGGR